MKQYSRALLLADFDTEWYKKWSKLLKQTEKERGYFALKANKFICSEIPFIILVISFTFFISSCIYSMLIENLSKLSLTYPPTTFKLCEYVDPEGVLVILLIEPE